MTTLYSVLIVKRYASKKILCFRILYCFNIWFGLPCTDICLALRMLGLYSCDAWTYCEEVFVRDLSLGIPREEEKLWSDHDRVKYLHKLALTNTRRQAKLTAILVETKYLILVFHKLSRIYTNILSFIVLFFLSKNNIKIICD